MEAVLTDEELSFLRKINSNLDDVAPRLVFADWLDERGRHEEATMFRGVVKRFNVDFHSPGGALTIGASEVCDTGAESGTHSRTHDSGWTITGMIHEDYYTWVNDFFATHPQHGRIEGNFEIAVFAASEEAFQHFFLNHTPNAWDYQDI